MTRMNRSLYQRGCDYSVLYALNTIYIYYSCTPGTAVVQSLSMLQLENLFFPEVSNFP